MSNNKTIGIDVSENGFIVTAKGKTYIFDNIKKVREWIEENISATGDIKQFSDALDDNKSLGNEALADVLEQLKSVQFNV